MNWDILMLFQFKCLKFIFFVKSSRIQGGEHAIRQIRFAWPYIFYCRESEVLICVLCSEPLAICPSSLGLSGKNVTAETHNKESAAAGS